MSISADYRNGTLYPLPTIEETTKAVAAHVVEHILEVFPNTGLKIEDFNKVNNEGGEYNFQALCHLVTFIKGVPSIEIAEDELLKQDDHVLVAKRIDAVLIPVPKSKPGTASDLKGRNADANHVFGALGAWEDIERNPESSKHKKKRAGEEMKRIHRLITKSKPEVTAHSIKRLLISNSAWQSIRLHGEKILLAKMEAKD